ncbi:Proteophosphoglycan ppg4 [Rhodotorula toruloides ATCC 204091]|uniref:Proteophosphoglycan ppg4 n=1 Tax=Rhodotorula toruloides TaxID=5286 RepID=A0A0K3CD04_RHOTO|nr:Proteophosphoglycan ppg4 [Rhodotorula toruloides ATCC 204091]KAK4334690.1 Proteophosphoglycan ppg4 [Rhodotorula toruloides]PRQ76584.1 Proteophosphoglycan ppg4 [Rhodotorula toruloides]
MTDTKLLAHLKSVHAAAEDGTTSYPRFIQDQLIKLYNILSESRDELLQALQADTGLTSAEAHFELAETLQLVKRFAIAELDYEKWNKGREKALKEEGVSRRGKGVCLLLGNAAAPVYSVIGPLATAMAAGNAVVSLLSSETKAVSSLLESKLSARLDRFAYFFTRSSSLSEILSISSLPSPALVVGRTLPSLPDTLPRILNTSGSSGSTVLIDRLSPNAHQNIAHLARLIVRGKFHALGRLPGSVARVLVHEESAGVVLDAVMQALKEAYGVDAALSGDYGRMRGEWDGEKKVRAEREKGEGKVVCGGAKGAKEAEGYFPPTVVEQPTLTFLRQDPAGPILSFATFASHEHALVLLNKMDSQTLFLFSNDPHNLDYLAVEAGVPTVYMNDIPVSALYEPARNITDVSNYTLTTRVIRPSHAPSPTSKLFAPFPSSRLSALSSLFPRERTLKFVRAKHSNSILRVFFLQGVFISVGTILACLLGTTGYGAYLGFGYLRRRFFV